MEFNGSQVPVRELITSQGKNLVGEHFLSLTALSGQQ